MIFARNTQPTFLSVAPRFAVQNLEQALAFYGQLEFQVAYGHDQFAIVARDDVDLHFNYVSDSPGRHVVCCCGYYYRSSLPAICPNQCCVFILKNAALGI